MKSWEYPSSSGPGTYTTTLADDGLLSCNCRGFLIKKADKPRYCRHTDDVVKKLGLNIVQRGDYQYATDGGTVQGELIPQVDHVANFQIAKERGYINPMLAVAPTKGQTVTDYDPLLWVMEEKYDGERKIVSGHAGSVYCWSRPRSGKGEVGKEDVLPPHIHAAFEAIAKVYDFVIDGELMAPGASKSWDVANLDNRNKLRFVAFDILKLGCEELVGLNYITRRKALEQFYQNVKFDGEEHPCLTLSTLYQPLLSEVTKIWDRGGEGAIVKKKTSIYRPGWRCPEWIKIKLIMSATLEIIGYKAGKNGPYSSVNLRDADGIETRVKTKDNATLRAIAADPDSWIGKRLVIEYQGRTPDKSYRHPMWDHLAGEGE